MQTETSASVAPLPLLGGRSQSEWLARYEIDGGKLIHKLGRRRGREAGSEIRRRRGRKRDGELRVVGRCVRSAFKGKYVMAHRLIHFMETGELPPDKPRPGQIGRAHV